MRVHRILRETAAEGPGLRYCVWVQGCSHHCPGCFAKDTWDSEKGRWIEIEDIKEDLRRAIQSAAEKRKDLEGLTLLGGEPFDQAQEAAQLAKEAKKHGLSVLTFTGYRLEELRKKGPAERKLLKRTDLLIDGPFEEEKKSFDRPLVGSSNQRFHFLTDWYKKEDIMSWKNSFEIRIDQDGRIWINGMGDFEALKNYEKRRHSSNEISWD